MKGQTHLVTLVRDRGPWAHYQGQDHACEMCDDPEEIHAVHTARYSEGAFDTIEYTSTECESSLNEGVTVHLCDRHLDDEAQATGIPRELIIAGYHPDLEHVMSELRDARAVAATDATVSVRAERIRDLEAMAESLSGQRRAS